MTTELSTRDTIQPGSEAGTYALAMLSEQDFTLRLESLKQGRERIAEIQKKLMRPGVDYGKIPGTGDRPTLLKPGAEKLADFYRFAAGMDARMEPGNGETAPVIRYEVRCTLHLGSLDGPIVATGWGVCTSHEKKYRYRNEWTGSGPSRTKTRVLNDDPWEQANTILKIAEKRAFIDAVLRATASSGLFTQDVGDDDLPEDQPERKRGPAQAAPSPSASAPVQYRRAELVDLMKAKSLDLNAVEVYANLVGIPKGAHADNEQMDALIAAIEGHGTEAVIEPGARARELSASEGTPPPSDAPPKPGTPEYKALPDALDRAAARVYWDANPEPEPETLAEQLQAVPS